LYQLFTSDLVVQPVTNVLYIYWGG